MTCSSENTILNCKTATHVRKDRKYGVRFKLPTILAQYSPMYIAAYLFGTVYALIVFGLSLYYTIITPPETNNEYARIVADRLLTGRMYVLPIFYIMFQVTFWKQKYFSEALVATLAWLSSTYLDDYFALGSEFTMSYLWQYNILLALRPIMIIALLWMVLEERQRE